jgi:predicted ATPase/DNA-binding SARP family transcriptional activator
MPPLSLTLFGSFTAVLGHPAVLGHTTLRLPTDKTRALLAYLALTPDTPLRRETLAALLWPDQPEELARQNLRKTLGRLRQAIVDAEPTLADHLFTLTKQTIELHAAYCSADVRTFTLNLEAVRQHPHDPLARCPDCLTRLEAAVTLYRQGELLAGLSLPDAYPFEEWLLMQRENLYQQQLNALHNLAAAFEQQGVLDKARQYAHWQIQQEPWREEAHRQLMRLLAGQGQRAEAIAQYQACRQLLEAELGIEPSPETEALLAQITAGSLPPLYGRFENRPSPRPHPLPRLPAPLIGRQAEITQLITLLTDPTCRLLTITGPGGIGKTSLGIAVGEALRRQPPPWLTDGLYFVSLAEITDPALIPAAIAEALGLSLNRRQSVASQVEQSLRQQSTLLILDNVEHLASDADWLRHLAATSPRLKLLLTSREPLNWHGEWRYPLEGLAYPQEEAGGEQYEAVRLFVQAARHVKPGFAYTPENGRAINRICHLLDGWPLALQMAAAWVRLMPCQAIAGQISHSLDFLTTPLRDLPPRQRSMRVIFDYTWASLNAEEQHTLAQLAVFRGGFTLAAAVEVAAASPLILLGLVDKSLPHYDEQTGRYHLHELLRQFALEKASAGPAIHASASQSHSRYYLNLLQTEGQHLYTTQFQAALELIKADLDNVRQAWLWAAGSQQDDLLTANLGHLARFYESSGLLEEAVAVLRQTLTLLEQRESDRPLSLMAQIHYHNAQTLRAMGRYTEATIALATAQQIAQSLNDPSLVNRLFIAQALLLGEQGDYDQALTILDRAIALCRAGNNLEEVARTLHIQGNTYWYIAAYDQAMPCYEEAHQIYQQLGNARSAAILTGNFGVVQWRLGQYPAALANYEIALTAATESGDATSIALWLGNMGLLLIDLHEDERAMTYLDSALTMHDQLGRKFYKIEEMLGKVALLLRRGEIESAAHLHRQATDLSTQIGNRAYLLDCDLWQARLHLANGQTAEAIHLLQSLLTREFRPDALATITRELEKLSSTG